MYQVLYDIGNGRAGVIDCKTKARAVRKAKELRQAGEKGVSIWNTKRNTLSDLLRF